MSRKILTTYQAINQTERTQGWPDDLSRTKGRPERGAWIGAWDGAVGKAEPSMSWGPACAVGVEVVPVHTLTPTSI